MTGRSSVRTTAHPPMVQNLVDLARQRAQVFPDRLAYGYLEKGETLSQQISFGEIDQKARAVAAQLQAQDLQGKCAVLIYPSGIDFVVAYWACLYAGVIAVPCYPPQMGRKIDRLSRIITDCQASLLLSNRRIREQVSEEMPSLPWFLTDEVDESQADLWQMPALSSDSLAFLQYTSGSTGQPKGVMVSHGNLIHNQQLIYEGFGHNNESKVLSWLPLFHDMGLIGHVIQPMYIGNSSYLMSPMSFMQKPLRWLKAIDQYQIHSSGGPNFAYELLLNKVSPEERESLDLSSWEVAYNGSEPVKAETMRQFAAAFAISKFSSKACYPCYGMAETTLMISGRDKGMGFESHAIDRNALSQNRIFWTTQDHPEAQEIVNCGPPRKGLKARILKVETQQLCDKNEIGEIWIQGGSVSPGYWQQAELNETIFQAEIKGQPAEGQWLRTGDLGFMREGDLYITGRLKDLIIIRGKNYYPQDIEASIAESHPAFNPGTAAVFSIEESGTEQLVVLQELERGVLKKYEAEALIQAIRKAVGQAHELTVFAVCLLKRRSLPKTSSGKMQRFAAKKGFLQNQLPIEAEWRAVEAVAKAPVPETKAEMSSLNLENWIRNWISQEIKMPVKDIDPRDPISAYGVDSLAMTQFEEMLSEYLGFDWPVKDYLLQEPSIQKVAEKGFELWQEKQGK